MIVVVQLTLDVHLGILRYTIFWSTLSNQSTLSALQGQIRFLGLPHFSVSTCQKVLAIEQGEREGGNSVRIKVPINVINGFFLFKSYILGSSESTHKDMSW